MHFLHIHETVFCHTLKIFFSKIVNISNLCLLLHLVLYNRSCSSVMFMHVPGLKLAWLACVGISNLSIRLSVKHVFTNLYSKFR